MLLRTTILSLATIAIGTGQAQAQNGGYVRPLDPTMGMLRKHLTERLNDIREKGLQQQIADGGTLTPAHRDQLQAKIDEAHVRYADQRRFLGQPVDVARSTAD